MNMQMETKLAIFPVSNRERRTVNCTTIEQNNLCMYR
jgi:hypothetical protein